MKSRKHKEAFWLTNLVEFQIFLLWRVLENHFRKKVMGRLWKKLLCVHIRLSTFCRLPWILAQLLMDKIKTYCLPYQELETKPFCAAFRFMTSQISPDLGRM